MPGPDPVLFHAVFASGSHLPAAGGLLAYGPAPGAEVIPYFLALLSWIGVAFAAVLLWPFTTLLRRIRRGRGAAPAAPQPPSEPPAAPAPPAAREGAHDHA